MLKQAVGYIRVSTEDQTLSPEGQKKTLTEWSAKEGYQLINIFSDIGVSGGSRLEKRLSLLACIDALSCLDAPRGQRALVVAKRDRFTRDPIVGAMAERLIERAGGVLVSADGAGNGNDPTQVLMRRMVDAFAEYERALIGVRTRTALAVRKAQGRTTGEAPWGMAVGPDGQTLVECPREQEVLTIARGARRDGKSYRAIVSLLTSRGCVSRTGKPLAVAQVFRMVGKDNAT